MRRQSRPVPVRTAGTRDTLKDGSGGRLRDVGRHSSIVPSVGQKGEAMSVTDWIFFGATFAAILFAVWSLRVAASYRFQVENVQMAASIARDQNAAQRQ